MLRELRLQFFQFIAGGSRQPGPRSAWPEPVLSQLLSALTTYQQPLLSVTSTGDKSTKPTQPNLLHDCTAISPQHEPHSPSQLPVYNMT